jgi:hypothetical protein
VPNSRDAEVLQVLCRQVRQDTFIDVVFAEASKRSAMASLPPSMAPALGVRCACAITDEIKPLGIEVRAGLHTSMDTLRGYVRDAASRSFSSFL